LKNLILMVGRPGTGLTAAARAFAARGADMVCLERAPLHSVKVFAKALDKRFDAGAVTIVVDCLYLSRERPAQNGWLGMFQVVGLDMHSLQRDLKTRANLLLCSPRNADEVREGLAGCGGGFGGAELIDPPENFMDFAGPDPPRAA